jgi:hypothetical protein
VEVRRRMVVEEHGDRDAVERADPRHEADSTHQCCQIRSGLQQDASAGARSA